MFFRGVDRNHQPDCLTILNFPRSIPLLSHSVKALHPLPQELHHEAFAAEADAVPVLEEGWNRRVEPTTFEGIIEG